MQPPSWLQPFLPSGPLGTPKVVMLWAETIRDKQDSHVWESPAPPGVAAAAPGTRMEVWSRSCKMALAGHPRAWLSRHPLPLLLQAASRVMLELPELSAGWVPLRHIMCPLWSPHSRPPGAAAVSLSPLWGGPFPGPHVGSVGGSETLENACSQESVDSPRSLRCC